MLSFLEEAKQLDGVGSAAATSTSLTLTISASCSSNGNDVIARIKDVLRPVVIARGHEKRWPTEDTWVRVLPTWFIQACAPEPTRAEADAWLAKWRTLPPAEQSAEAERQPWTLLDWLFWFAPGDDERQWRWLDAGIEDENRLWVTIEVAGYPTAYGALRWVMRAAGATDIDER